MTICVFGDSITFGASDLEKGGWVERLKIYFAENYDTDVYNLGISGNNTEDLLSRVEVETSARKPDIIIFAIGVNDSQYIKSKDNPRIALHTFEQNLVELVKIGQRVASNVIFVGLTPVDELKTKPIPWDIEKYYDTENVEKYNSVIQLICEKNSILFIDMRGVIKKEDLSDGLHPNAQGHEKMFQKIKVEVEKFYKT